jgi:hypothetical protein
MTMNRLGRLIGSIQPTKILATLTLACLLSACGVAALMGETKDAAPSGRTKGKALLIVPTPDGPVSKPTASPSPTKSKTSIPTAIATPQPIRLTQAGCCAYPSWSPDSNWVLFFDRPDEEAEAALYGVAIEGGDVTMVNDRIGIYTRDWTQVAYREEGQTIVERWADGARWTISNEGRTVRFSPSGRFVAWDVSSRVIKFPDLRQHAIWLANRDGTGGREVITVRGGELIGWVGGEAAILVSGSIAPNNPAGIWRVSVTDSVSRLLVQVDKVRSALLSPDGEWVVFTIAFDSDPDRNGLWVMRADGSDIRKIDLYGAYRWRRDGILLVIPLDLEAPGSSLWQVDAESGEAWRLTDPLNTPLQIANNDWQPSPDGSFIVFRSSQDHGLWLLGLPEP